MIMSSKKPGHQYLRKLSMLPIAAIVVCLFAFNYKTKAVHRSVSDIKSISVYKNETAILAASSAFAIKKNTFDAEVSTKKAESDLAYELQAAKIKQKIMPR